MKKRKFIYIAGFGRSGSSIFDMYLAKKHGFVSLGELTYFFERGIVNKELCSCGKSVLECSFWSKIVEEFGKDELLNNSEYYAKLNRKFEGTKKFLFYRFSRKIHENKDFKKYLEINEKLIDSIYKVYGDNIVLIDSSKFPTRGLWLLKYISKDLNLDVYIIHIVRDAIANAYSWTKKKLRPEASYNGKEVYMRQFNYWEAILRWISNNLSASNLRTLSSSNYILVKYEDFCKDPLQVSQYILKKLYLFPYKKNIWGYHSVSGNPIRLYNKNINIECDNTWKNKVQKYKIFISNFITFLPKKYIYHYPIAK